MRTRTTKHRHEVNGERYTFEVTSGLLDDFVVVLASNGFSRVVQSKDGVTWRSTGSADRVPDLVAGILSGVAKTHLEIVEADGTVGSDE